jgi:alkylhydroperoxidase/carboxymuconolactone decarboxylase family protein YurZ
MTAAEDLLRRLAAGEEPALRRALSAADGDPGALDRRTRALVTLSALLALDAPTVSLRVAVERVAASGLDDAAMLEVLVSAAAARGAAQTVADAPRLALALDRDVGDPGEEDRS